MCEHRRLSVLFLSNVSGSRRKKVLGVQEILRLYTVVRKVGQS